MGLSSVVSLRFLPPGTGWVPRTTHYGKLEGRTSFGTSSWITLTPSKREVSGGRGRCHGL